MGNVVITGANRGLGYQMVRKFAGAGYQIWACARTRTDIFEKEMAELSAEYNVKVQTVYFDLSREEEIKRGVREILAAKEPVDVLINNAGIAYGAPFNMTSTDKLREIYQVNVISQVLLMQLLSRSMIRRKKGCIINMCSVLGIDTSTGSLAYGSSKAALIWITKEAAKELAPYNIRVNGIAPGFVSTEMGRYMPPKELEQNIEQQLIQRMGRPEEIASAALYIASEEAAYMTGQIMVIDGGRLCR